MNRAMAKALAVVAAALAVAMTGVAPVYASPQPAGAVHPNACQPDPYVRVQQTGTDYSSIGSAVGKRNGSSVTSTLSFSSAVTQSRASSIAQGAKISINLAIVDVEGAYNNTVTKTTTTGWTATDTLSVPGGYYGYIQPKVEYHTYYITQWVTPGNCGNDTLSQVLGTSHFIVVNPFFSECTAKSACDPAP